ncbi:MAG: hypothetical protein U5R48_08625 [Gammaproteobacteria bacterium]|nr:hypothetical protein [Gammaproteobacteria bacterium]
MIGLLVNDNYLFMSYAYWDKTRGNGRFAQAEVTISSMTRMMISVGRK